MGIVKALIGSIGGGLADQWLEVIEADEMSDKTVFTSGVVVRPNDRRSSNRKGTEYTVSDGSIIHVYPNQFMMLVDGGKILDYTAEEGYYKVDKSSMPSLFNGQLGDALKETFSRVKFGGVPSSKQKVYFINLQEIKGIKFGTRAPVNYFDNFYNAELNLRAHGTYSIKITDPLKFYSEAIPKNADRVEIDDINEEYLSEFQDGLQTAINQMSADGVRISHVVSKSRELSRYMNDVLDEQWRGMRGMEIVAVGMASISYDDESQKLIHMRNQGAMLGDPSVREGYVQGAVARGLEAAGSNTAGSMEGFMGMGFGMNQSGGFMAAASRTNAQQMAAQQEQKLAAAPQAGGWKCACGAVNNGKFCPECGVARPVDETWNCPKCGASCKGKFCSECGTARPTGPAKCEKCGWVAEDGSNPKFCPECGNKF